MSLKSENIQIVKSLFSNPLSFLKLDTPQVYKNMTVIPIIVQDEKFIDFISIKEAEEQELIEIIETDTVGQLEVINKSEQSIVSENPGKFKQKYTIPAKCVEQSRWNYTEGRGFKSSNTRLHPNVAYEAISAAGQGAVWDEIQSHRSEMNYAGSIAPTQSYLEMTKESENQTEEFVDKFKNVENQCGIAVFINGKFIGIEFYANSEVWKTMSKDILKAFSIEALRFKDKPQRKVSEYHDELIKILDTLEFNYTKRDGVALGNIVEFSSNDNKWRGITLVHEKTMAQFYLVSKRGGSQGESRTNIQFQTVIDQRYQI
jgi:hypothetical protein